MPNGKASLILAQDDFQKGMYVTVHSLTDSNDGPDIEIVGPPMDMFGGLFKKFEIPKDPNESLKGIVIRIDAINLPYLMVSFYESFMKIDDNLTNGKEPPLVNMVLDSRDVNLMKVNYDYAKIYVGKNRFERWVGSEEYFNKCQKID